MAPLILRRIATTAKGKVVVSAEYETGATCGPESGATE